MVVSPFKPTKLKCFYFYLSQKFQIRLDIQNIEYALLSGISMERIQTSGNRFSLRVAILLFIYINRYALGELAKGIAIPLPLMLIACHAPYIIIELGLLPYFPLYMYKLNKVSNTVQCYDLQEPSITIKIYNF